MFYSKTCYLKAPRTYMEDGQRCFFVAWFHSMMSHICSGKVHIFWDGHKILRNIHKLFDWQYLGQIIGEDFANFVAFWEYMNFKHTYCSWCLCHLICTPLYIGFKAFTIIKYASPERMATDTDYGHMMAKSPISYPKPK